MLAMNGLDFQQMMLHRTSSTPRPSASETKISAKILLLTSSSGKQSVPPSCSQLEATLTTSRCQCCLQLGAEPCCVKQAPNTAARLLPVRPVPLHPALLAHAAFRQHPQHLVLGDHVEQVGLRAALRELVGRQHVLQLRSRLFRQLLLRFLDRRELRVGQNALILGKHFP